MLRFMCRAQQQDMQKDSAAKLQPSLMFLLFVALMCFVHVLLALVEELILEMEKGSFMNQTGVFVVAMLLPTVCLSIASWHKAAAPKDARKDCDEKELLVHDHQDVPTVTTGIHQAGRACREQKIVNQRQYLKTQYAAVATNASANAAHVHAVGRRCTKQVKPERQAAEEQLGMWRHREQQGQLQQQLQQGWLRLPQPQPGACVREPQLVMQSQQGKTAPRGRSSAYRPVYVKAGVRPSKSGAGSEARVPHIQA